MSPAIQEKVVNGLVAAIFLSGAALCKLYKIDGVYELCLIASGVSGSGRVSVGALFSNRPKAE